MGLKWNSNETQMGLKLKWDSNSNGTQTQLGLKLKWDSKGNQMRLKRKSNETQTQVELNLDSNGTQMGLKRRLKCTSINYCNFQVTIWKFSTTNILRETKIGESRASKIPIYHVQRL